MKSRYFPRLLKGKQPEPAPPAEAVTPDRQDNVPRHVAIIMDGNGRWARERGLPHEAGHQAGTENIRRIIETFARKGVSFLTLYAFSTENWGRPESEVQALLRLLGDVLTREVKELHHSGIRLRHIGRLEGLSDRLQRQVADAIELTKDNDRMTVCVAFNYGGRREIVDAVRQIIESGATSNEVSEALFSSYLYTGDVPDPDLIIRTAGELRLSNFLIWQAAYAELYFTQSYWPDFDEAEIELALLAYATRQRRFGGRPAEPARSKSSGETGELVPLAGADKF